MGLSFVGHTFTLAMHTASNEPLKYFFLEFHLTQKGVKHFIEPMSHDPPHFEVFEIKMSLDISITISMPSTALSQSKRSTIPQPQMTVSGNLHQQVERLTDPFRRHQLKRKDKIKPQ